jgi:hypothetical protein
VEEREGKLELEWLGIKIYRKICFTGKMGKVKLNRFTGNKIFGIDLTI